MTKKAIIYGVKSGDTYHYIGKTIQANKNGEITPSKVQTQYLKPKLREVFLNNVIEIENLQVVPANEWWDDKLEEVVEKHRADHPMHNAQCMKDGKRGICYWEGKQRDPHTLQRLSESKYKRCVQYNSDGELVKIWDSCKEAAIKVFGDYQIINGSAESKLYKLIKAHKIQNRLSHNSYWFTEEQLKKHFTLVPKRINIDAMAKAQRERVSRAISKGQREKTHSPQYEILKYNLKGKLIRTYPTAKVAGQKLGFSESYVSKLCRKGTRTNSFYLTYGEKKLQPITRKTT